MKLLLFDIDGTMLHTHGVGRRSVEEAIAEVFGRTVSTRGVSFSGKTDPQIMREVLVHVGIRPEDVNGAFEDVLAAYEMAMHRNLDPARVTLLPGVRPLLETLAPRPDVVLGLVTGNLASMAALKLHAVGLDDFFEVGAYGSDSAHRPDLPPIAVHRAEARSGHRFTGQDVVIIGDTEHDIDCGRDLGAFSIAVCTGHFGREHLAPHGPDVLLDDLTDAEGFLNLLR